MTTSPPPRPDLAPTAGAHSPGDLAPPPPLLRRGARSRGAVDPDNNQTTTSPPGRSQNPGTTWLTTPRCTPAWIAVLDLLSDGHWHPRTDVARVMAAAAHLAPRTIGNHLRSASARGWVRCSRGRVKLRDRHALEAALEEAGRG